MSINVSEDTSVIASGYIGDMRSKPSKVLEAADSLPSSKSSAEKLNVVVCADKEIISNQTNIGS